MDEEWWKHGYSSLRAQKRETYAPVAKETTIKWLLAWGHKNGMKFYQVDYHGAFLHSKIPEEFQIHMRTPKGTNIGKGKVLRCVKGLYGLKNLYYILKLQTKQDRHDVMSNV